MDPIMAEQLSKCYHSGSRPARPVWPQLLRRLRGEDAAPNRDDTSVREVWALRDISFRLAAGTILGIIGPDDSGKTTLIKVLSRITPPTSGRAIIRGRVVSLLRMGTGFQQEASGRENVFLLAALHGIGRREVQQRLPEIMDFAEIYEIIDRPLRLFPRHLQQRLAFSTMIHLKPNILLADDNLSIGDPAFRRACNERVQELSAEGLTVLFASHDVKIMTKLCNQVLWLDGGRVVRFGEARSVLADYERSRVIQSGQQQPPQQRDSPRNKFAEIKHTVLLSSEGQEIKRAAPDEDVSVKITFALYRGRIEVRSALDVFSHGAHVFRAIQQEATPIPEVGLYSAIMSLPANILAETAYSVNVAIIILKNGGEARINKIDALSFDVHAKPRSDAHEQGQVYRRKVGVVAPQVTWKIVPEGAVLDKESCQT